MRTRDNVGCYCRCKCWAIGCRGGPYVESLFGCVGWWKLNYRLSLHDEGRERREEEEGELNNRGVFGNISVHWNYPCVLSTSNDSSHFCSQEKFCESMPKFKKCHYLHNISPIIITLNTANSAYVCLRNNLCYINGYCSNRQAMSDKPLLFKRFLLFATPGQACPKRYIHLKVGMLQRRLSHP